MSEKEDSFLTPNMRRQEAREREAGFKGDFNPRTDFGAYAAMARRGDPSLLYAHVLAREEDARTYVECLERFLGSQRLRLSGAVLDAGSAVGTVTDALRSAGVERSIGVELSRDAVDVAASRYPRCEFLCAAVEEAPGIPDASLDAVHCREFYPFTRTTDIDRQLAYLKFFAAKLRPGGFVVLYMKQEGGLFATFDRVAKVAPSLGFARWASAVEAPMALVRRLGRLAGIVPRGAAAAAAALAGRTPGVWHLFAKR